MSDTKQSSQHKTFTTTISLDQEVHRKLKHLAVDRGVSVRDLIGEAIIREWAHDSQLSDIRFFNVGLNPFAVLTESDLREEVPKNLRMNSRLRPHAFQRNRAAQAAVCRLCGAAHRCSGCVRSKVSRMKRCTTVLYTATPPSPTFLYQ